MSSNTTRTDAQREASRSNGRHSRGAVTPEGKARSSRNAMKHGLRSPTVVLVNESQQDYDDLLNSYIAEWNPLGRTESDLLVSMVTARWRIERMRRMETGALNNEMFIQKPTMDAAFDIITPGMRQADAVAALGVHNPTNLDYFIRSEERLERILDRAEKRLLRLQKMRLRADPELVPQPGLTASEFTNTTNEPGETPDNSPETETFAFISAFSPTRQRPSTDRSTWTDDTYPPPKEPGNEKVA